MHFTKLRLTGWRQFKVVDIDLHPRLTILTGANGAGKTTLLNMLGRHFGWQTVLVSTPRRKAPVDDQGTRYKPDYWRHDIIERIQEIEDLFDDASADPVDDAPTGPEREIGYIAYSSGPQASLKVPSHVGSTYHVAIHGQQPVKGLHIPSHRPIYSYQPVQTIPTMPRKRQEMFSLYMQIVQQRHLGGHHQWTPNYFIKETLIALATFGYGNVVVEANPESLQIFKRFEQVLSQVLPPTLGFQKIIIRIPEVVISTESGEFSLDAVSGGVASIIDIAWQIFMYESTDCEYVVTIDEPENHLHPELQRTFLSSLLQAFPKVQFIVASHNPFIVSSVPDSNVYVLRYDDSRRVYSLLLDTANRAGSSNEVLRDVLGLDFTIPLWVETQLDKLVKEYEDKELTAETVASLRKQLGDLGLARHIPDTIARLAERSSRHD